MNILCVIIILLNKNDVYSYKKKKPPRCRNTPEDELELAIGVEPTTC